MACNLELRRKGEKMIKLRKDCHISTSLERYEVSNDNSILEKLNVVTGRLCIITYGNHIVESRQSFDHLSSRMFGPSWLLMVIPIQRSDDQLQAILLPLAYEYYQWRNSHLFKKDGHKTVFLQQMRFPFLTKDNLYFTMGIVILTKDNLNSPIKNS